MTVPIQEVVLHPTGGLPLALQGRVVAHALGPTNHPKLFGRHHEITVYEASDGLLCLVVEFHSRCLHEEPFCEVANDLQLDDFPSALFVVDAVEHVNQNMIRGTELAAASRLVRQLDQQYDLLCDSIQTQLLTYAPTVRVGSVSDTTSKSRWFSWMKNGGDRRNTGVS